MANKLLTQEQFQEGIKSECERLIKWIDKTEYPPISYSDFILKLLLSSKRIGYFEIVGMLEDLKYIFLNAYNQEGDENEE